MTIHGKIKFSSVYKLGYFCLLLTSIVKGRLFQRSTAVVYLDNVTIGRQFTGTTHADIIFTIVLGKAPFQRLEDLLAPGKLELAPTNGLNDVCFVGVLGADREQNLTNINAGSHTNGFAVRVAHTTRQTIGTGATQHFVGAQDVEGVGADPNVVGFLPDRLGQVLVDGNTASLQGFGRDLLLFITDQVGDKGKEIDGRLFGTRIKNTNLGFRDTTTLCLNGLCGHVRGLRNIEKERQQQTNLQLT